LRRATVQQAREWIKQASSVAVLTGAGISAESGIQTFRDQNGHWQGRQASELASLDGFLADPTMVWEWYLARRRQLRSCQPNPGHQALAHLEHRKPSCTVITQNVDRLHQQAGSRHVIELHGHIWGNRCLGCQQEFDVSNQDVKLELNCPDCGHYLRPTVVWFGEALPEGSWEKAASLASQAEVFLVIGTSAVVYPAAGLIPLAKNHGSKVIEINLAQTEASYLADLALQGPSAQILPEIIRA
jgi:NAD-dependent deacetylase